MGIALHPYLVGQPYRLRHLRRALEHVVQAIASGSPRLAASREHIQAITPTTVERSRPTA
jgi:hypothetical protein